MLFGNFVSDCIRSNLRGCKFKNFPRGACPQTPLVDTDGFHMLLWSYCYPVSPYFSKNCMKFCVHTKLESEFLTGEGRRVVSITLMSGVQNCNRALERMIQCIVLAVGPLPLRPPHVHLTFMWWMLPGLPHSSPAMYYCECKRGRPGNEGYAKSVRVQCDCVETY